MNEDFVTFDLAKKLKEKGFNRPCLAHYTNGKFEYNIAYFDEVTLPDLYENWGHGAGCFVDAPTISQVLKWLREEKKILVVAAPAFSYREARYFWQCGIYEISLLPNVMPFHKFIDNKESYDSAILTGIDYVIDNWI